ncbi:MAG: DNA polymerase III subunit delta [Nitrospinota bacterium]|nr:DNA polymerase III subunit delta [Nitrospinota bacterium]
MARIAASEFEKAQAKGSVSKNPLSLYFLYGPDSSRIHAAAEEIKKSLTDKTGEEGDYFRIMNLGDGPDDTSVQEVIAGLNTVSMFGGGKLFWIGPVSSLPKHIIEPLAAYAQDPNPQSTLVMTAALGRKDQLKAVESSSFYAAVEKNGAVVRFEKMREKDLALWASRKLAELGVKAKPEAAALMAEFCGKDMARLAMEIEKVAAYAGYTGSLTALDVEESMVDMRMEKVWGFTDAFCSGNMVKSHATLQDLLDNGSEPQVILKTLSLEVMKFAAAADLKSKGGTQQEFCALMGENPYALRAAWEKGKMWTTQRAQTALKAILKAQMDMMIAGAPKDAALEAMLLEGIPKGARQA